MSDALRERIDEVLRIHREKRNTAAARVEQARQKLISLAAGVDADTCEPDDIRAAADDLASHVQSLREEDVTLSELRRLLI